MRYFIVLDMPDTTYPITNPFYAPNGEDPYGRSSLAGWIGGTLVFYDAETGKSSGPPDDLTVYSDVNDLLSDMREGLDMFAPKP